LSSSRTRPIIEPEGIEGVTVESTAGGRQPGDGPGLKGRRDAAVAVDSSDGTTRRCRRQERWIAAMDLGPQALISYRLEEVAKPDHHRGRGQAYVVMLGSPLMVSRRVLECSPSSPQGSDRERGARALGRSSESTAPRRDGQEGRVDFTERGRRQGSTT